MNYKESNYNVYLEYEEKKLVFNGITSAFAEIEENEEFFEILEKIKNNEALENVNMELLKQMEDAGFIVNANFDEVKWLKMGSYNSKFNSDTFGLTIAPTLSCNFACPYCYENATKDFMKDEIQNAIIALIEKMAKDKKNISITWYGGEPILAKKIIKSLTDKFLQICEENKVEYDAYMVSNGYLITEEIAKELKEEKIHGVQLTIDGPPRIHNERRKLRNSNEDTFYRIVESANILKHNGIEVHIRVNVDNSNKDSFGELLDLLKENNLNDCAVNLGHVKAYTNACSSVVSSCIANEEFAEFTIECQKMMREKDFTATEYPYYPGIKGNYCCSDSAYAYVVDPNGYLYKCWNDIGNEKKSVGNVMNIEEMSVENEIVNMEYMMWSPFEIDECIECKFLPMCMGGCPYMGIQRGKKPECENWKYTLNKTLIETYESKKDTLD